MTALVLKPFLLALCAFGAPARAAQPGSVDFVLFHTNDIHGNIDPMPSFATLLSRESLPHAWLDSGDWFQGTPEGNMTHGEAMIDLFGRLGLAASAIGNHDYDEGEATVAKLCREAKFPCLGSNILAESGALAGYVTPYLILQASPGVKIGVFGLLTQSMPNLAFERHIKGLRFAREADVARKAVAELKAKGAGVIVAVTHMGIEENGGRRNDIQEGDLFLARNVPGIDLILGGHTHDQLSPPPVVEGQDGRRTLITQTNAHLKTVYRLLLRIDPATGRLRDVESALIHIDSSTYAPDPAIAAVVARYKSTVEREMSVVIGEAKGPLETQRNPESPMADWVTDTLRRFGKTDLAAMNTFGIRGGLPSGRLTYGDVYHVMPFENALAEVALSGAEVKKLVEKNIGTDVLYLQYSGLEYVFDPKAPEGRRLRKITVGGAPLDEKRRYTLTCPDFLATTDKGMRGIEKTVSPRPELIRDVLVDEVKRGPIVPRVDGRAKPVE